ncbi:MAG: Bacterial type secretion system protein domain protein [Phycisphaerales bacterium]|nr:Bacterial type secretion system protein domain protein [Phycisphaerales bacterium]
MTTIFFQIIVAVTVASLVMGLWNLLRMFMDQGEQRKINGRLKRTIEDQVQSDLTKSLRRRTGLDEVQGLLGRFEIVHNVNKTLLQSAPNVTLKKFLWIVASSAVGLMLMVFLITMGVFVSLVAAILGGAVPFLVLMNKRNRRQKLMADQLPDALDFLCRALRAGHSMSTGFQLMAEELPQPISGEFRRVYEQHSLGASMEDTLRAAVDRVDSSDFAFFVTAVLIQRQTGGDLGEVLNNIGAMIRHRVRLQQHVKAKTAEGRFTGYILAAFPAVMFVLSYCLNKEYAGRLLEQTIGIIMLSVAFGLQLLGLFVIRKITTIKV